MVIGLLVFPDGFSGAAHIEMLKAVKRTLKSKLRKNTAELKGGKLALSIKKYFLREASKQQNWCLYVAISDKKSWINNHLRRNHKLEKKALYDEIAKHIFF